MRINNDDNPSTSGSTPSGAAALTTNNRTARAHTAGVRALAIGATLVLGAMLAACTAADGNSAPGTGTDTGAAATQSTAADAVLFEDTWAKAASAHADDNAEHDMSDMDHGDGTAQEHSMDHESSDHENTEHDNAEHAGGMSAVFGVLKNQGSKDFELVSVETDIAGVTELHETVVEGGVSTMRQMAGGIKIAAGKSVTLEPGGTHIMLMQLHEPVLPGSEVRVTLHFSDGSSSTVTVLGKEFAGANEKYEG